MSFSGYFNTRFFQADSHKQPQLQDLRYRYINTILDNHKHLNFVQRILNPVKKINMPETGRTATHYMVYSNIDGSYAVYPRIVEQGNGQLKLLSETEAWNHAKQTGEFIKFQNKKGAEWFSYHYKDIWKQDKYKQNDTDN